MELNVTMSKKDLLYYGFVSCYIGAGICGAIAIILYVNLFLTILVG